MSEIGGRFDYPSLTKELAQDIETLWKDDAIQAIFPLIFNFSTTISKETMIQL